ncbi:hypothetical protein GYMLUDRAFT_250405 [Collybiopsis luxurians FD-317 M1]|uniref:Uncharacterized protein n=1 Tax=Collybiopsis luxurians FD-317 M1 TaxID=944289 RepID=A0A0D0ASQ8_9AGAR|nr:hypothetical protein GYMLUDRAFT_250405 [Collybiopsis luxurians FD-317 M1]
MSDKHPPQHSSEALLEPYEGFSPRVSGKLLSHFFSCYVTLPCEIIDNSLGYLTVHTCDRVPVKVSLLKVQTKPMSRFVDILSKYCSDDGGLLVATRITNLGEEFDLKTAEHVIDLIHREPWATEIFNVHAQHDLAMMNDLEVISD